MDQLLSDSQQILTDYGLKILAAIAIFIIGKWVARILTRFVTRLMKKSSIETTLVTFV